MPYGAIPFTIKKGENMGKEKLENWAKRLLDTGKRNNLINFNDSHKSSIEIIAPSYNQVFASCKAMTRLEVYDSFMERDEEIEVFPNNQSIVRKKPVSKVEVMEVYSPRLSGNQILLYNPASKPIQALKAVGKRARTSIEETGVNIAYITFGAIKWKETGVSGESLTSPLLLIPISVENASHAEPFYIRALDNEAVLNPTLEYKLRHEYGISLPQYEDDYELDTYLSMLQEAVSRVGWTVSAECYVGIFSFLKINMYNDLMENQDRIVENEAIRALMGEAEYYAGGSDTEEDEDLLCNVVDADSSQLNAIKMAKQGKSFVLQGPPGTGKSQTITNIIAQCLYEGKRVLFVSEKLAALNVVYSKLKSIGLDEFCLELHNHKTNKKQVIEELCRTLKLKKSEVVERAGAEQEARRDAQEKLNSYSDELHNIRPVINRTLYSLYEECCACGGEPDIEFIINDITSKGESYISEALSMLRKYVEFTPSVGVDYYKNPWYGYTETDSSYAKVVTLKKNIEATIKLLKGLLPIVAEIKEKYSVEADSIVRIRALLELFKLLSSSKYISYSAIDRLRIDTVIAKVNDLKSISEDILARRSAIGEIFDNDIYDLDGNDIYKRLTKEFTGIFSRLFSKDYKGIMRQLRLCKHDGKKLKYENAIIWAKRLSECQEKMAGLNATAESLGDCLNSNYDGFNTPFDDMLLELSQLKELMVAEIDLSDLSLSLKDDFTMHMPRLAGYCTSVNRLFELSEGKENQLASAFDESVLSIAEHSMDAILEKLEKCYEKTSELESWCEFNRLMQKLTWLGLKDYIDFAIENAIPPSRIVGAYKKAFYVQWVDHIIHNSSVLLDLTRLPHDEVVEIFRSKDELSFQVNRAILKARLSGERPMLDMVAPGSPISILLREGEKKSKQKGIRKLITELGELVHVLKPLFLMSPLSVSTYLSGDVSFDVVVFDEASQIFPQDAIGAIYRGKQIIVVGDSKQMPPSNFFTSMSDTEELGEDDFEDFESILDICSATFPQCSLKWHYRSRYEQLISFSNKNFYNYDLITFPSSQQDRRGNGVDYYYVDGVYDKSTRTNMIEANKVVEMVYAHFVKYPERSLGVVAFNQSQQELIEKLLARKRRDDPRFEEMFKPEREEPFFIKNLETVQGDERDTIIFSVSYAKDASGKLLLNFGPINKRGGERRLNVAFTRAKCNVQLVSSMHYYDIDLSRVESEGAKLLREYLDFAENGMIALERSEAEGEIYDSPFEKDVYSFLTKNGYRVDRLLGCSSYKIDLAVKRADSSDYALAIECDGVSYSCERNARDRDRLRPSVLERMGWHFYRIWSTDWMRNKRLEQERLLEAVRRAMEAPVVITEEETESFVSEIEETGFEFPVYERVDIERAEEECGYNLLQTIRAILETEAPLSEEWLLKRIAHMLDGRGRVTTAVRGLFEDALLGCESLGIIRRGAFMYLAEKEVPMLRVPKDGEEEKREIKYISKEELAKGMLEIIRRNVSVEKVNLYKYLVQLLGFTRTGDAIIACLDSALAELSDNVAIDGEVITFKP